MAKMKKLIGLVLFLSLLWVQAAHAQTPTPEPDLAEGMISCYELDEESGVRSDSFGSNHLSEQNTVGYTGGLIGNAAMFLGQNLELLYLDNNDFPIDNDPRSFFLWIKTDLVATNILFYGGENYCEFFLFTFNEAPFGLYIDDDCETVFSNLLINPGQWNLVGFTYDELVLTIYRDEDSYSDEISQPLTAEGPFYSPFSPPEFGEIDIDLLMVWGRALTQSEVTQLYNSSAGRSCADIISPTTPTETPSVERRIDLSSGDWMNVKREFSYGDMSLSILLAIILVCFLLVAIIITVDRWIRK